MYIRCVYQLILCILEFKNRPKTYCEGHAIHRSVLARLVSLSSEWGLYDFIQNTPKKVTAGISRWKVNLIMRKDTMSLIGNCGSSYLVPLSKPLVLWGVRLVHTLKGLQNQAHGFFPFPDPHANTSWSSSTSQSSLVALDHVPGKYRRKKLIMPMLFSSGNLCISFILLHQTYQQWKFRTKFFLFFGGRKKCCVGCLWYVKPEYRVASSAWHSLKN